MTGAEIAFVREVFEISITELSEILGVARISALRWERDRNAPTGLHKAVLRALHHVALEVRRTGDDKRVRSIRALLKAGIGELVVRALRQADG